jgi:hypothetical protein
LVTQPASDHKSRPSFQHVAPLVLHSHEIRKEHGEFGVLRKVETRTAFIERLNGVIQAADFTIIASIIDKQRHVARYHQPADPYEMALGFCMEGLQRCLMERSRAERMTYVQVERRGKTEDTKLELAFRRICDGQNAVGPMPAMMRWRARHWSGQEDPPAGAMGGAPMRPSQRGASRRIA